MVEGLPLKGSLMAVDLDGTLLRGNSLHLYIRCGLRHGSLRCRLGIAAALLRRKLRLSSHLEMKRLVLDLIEPTEALKADFISRAAAMHRPAVDAAIAAHTAAGGSVILASAAPETYIPWIWEGDFVATDAAAAVECRGTEKLARVLAYAQARGLQLAAVLTDHPDDLPLLTYPSIKRVLVGTRHKSEFEAMGWSFDSEID